jgi:GR25 family glycosyltransferase involved in LPS biosynthesis
VTTFLIYTAKNLGRLEHAREQCRSVGLTPIEVQGFHGLTLGLQQKHHEYWPDRTPEGKEEYHVTPGHLSLCLNHMMVWQMAAVADLEKVLILEDDVVFTKGFQDRIGIIAKEMDGRAKLDAVWLEHCCVDQENLKRVGSSTWKSKSHMCTAAILWNKSGYTKALDTFHSIPLNTHVDILMVRHLFPKCRFGVAIPELAVQRTNGHGWESSLSGR